jgi:hypothetical protein
MRQKSDSSAVAVLLTARGTRELRGTALLASLPHAASPVAPVIDIHVSQHAARALFGVSLTTWERLVEAGRVPKPDAGSGWSPRWKLSTLRAALEKGGAI